jgi:hypothetical protein
VGAAAAGAAVGAGAAGAAHPTIVARMVTRHRRTRNRFFIGNFSS